MVIVKRKLPCATVIGGILFVPGSNLVSDAEFAKLTGVSSKFKKCFDSEVKAGNMVVTSHVQSETSEAVDADSLEARAAKLALEVSTLNVTDAKQKLSIITDPYVLKAVLKEDSRKSIRQTVELRLQSIVKQEHSDLRAKSVPAPMGDGFDEAMQAENTEEAKTGLIKKTAIPALRPRRSRNG